MISASNNNYPNDHNSFLATWEDTRPTYFRTKSITGEQRYVPMLVCSHGLMHWQHWQPVETKEAALVIARRQREHLIRRLRYGSGIGTKDLF